MNKKTHSTKKAAHTLTYTLFSAFALSILSLGGAVFINNTFAASDTWLGPSGGPSTFNVPAPLNIGSTNQTKVGGITLGADLWLNNTEGGLNINGTKINASSGIKFFPSIGNFQPGYLYNEAGTLKYQTKTTTGGLYETRLQIGNDGNVSIGSPSVMTNKLNVGGNLLVDGSIKGDSLYTNQSINVNNITARGTISSAGNVTIGSGSNKVTIGNTSIKVGNTTISSTGITDSSSGIPVDYLTKDDVALFSKLKTKDFYCVGNEWYLENGLLKCGIPNFAGASSGLVIGMNLDGSFNWTKIVDNVLFDSSSTKTNLGNVSVNVKGKSYSGTLYESQWKSVQLDTKKSVAGIRVYGTVNDAGYCVIKIGKSFILASVGGLAVSSLNINGDVNVSTTYLYGIPSDFDSLKRIFSEESSGKTGALDLYNNGGERLMFIKAFNLDLIPPGKTLQYKQSFANMTGSNMNNYCTIEVLYTDAGDYSAKF